MKRIKQILLVLCAGMLPLGSTCAMDTRDAIISGAMDFISGTTAELLSTILSGALGTSA